MSLWNHKTDDEMYTHIYKSYLNNYDRYTLKLSYHKTMIIEFTIFCLLILTAIIAFSIVKMTDVPRTWFKNWIHSLYMLCNKCMEIKRYGVVSPLNLNMIGVKYLHISTFTLLLTSISPVYHIHYICNKIATTFNIIFLKKAVYR